VRLGATIRPSLRYRGQLVVPDLQHGLTICEFIVTLIASMYFTLHFRVILSECVFCLSWITAVPRSHWRETNCNSFVARMSRNVDREIFSVEDIYFIIKMGDSMSSIKIVRTIVNDTERRICVTTFAIQ
jgi:hypothetical protein